MTTKEKSAFVTCVKAFCLQQQIAVKRGNNERANLYGTALGAISTLAKEMCANNLYSKAIDDAFAELKKVGV